MSPEIAPEDRQGDEILRVGARTYRYRDGVLYELDDRERRVGTAIPARGGGYVVTPDPRRPRPSRLDVARLVLWVLLLVALLVYLATR